MAVFRATFLTSEPFNAGFITDDSFRTEFGAVFEIGGQEPVEEYTGEYEVEPSFDDQILETSGKKMLDDLKVNRIAVSSVGNLAGGNTVYIGGAHYA